MPWRRSAHVEGLEALEMSYSCCLGVVCLDVGERGDFQAKQPVLPDLDGVPQMSTRLRAALSRNLTEGSGRKETDPA